MNDPMIPRKKYIEELDSYRKNDELIKVITGARRTGKSELLKQFRNHLITEGIAESNIIRIDLEEMRFVIDSKRMLYETIRKQITGDGAFILLDEVQIIKGWEEVVETLRLQFKANIYITGSNSQMLSSELMTHLTGRYVEIHVLPFSFNEFIERYPIDKENGYTQRFYTYLRWGGMPIVDLHDSEMKNRAILSAVYDSILNNDIRSRVEIDQGTIGNLTRFMLSNVGNLVSTGRISKGSGITDNRTTEKYLNELCNCYLFYKADNYDTIGRKHLSTNAKFYALDTGMRNSIMLGSEYNEAALLENAVYIELLRRGYLVSVGSFKDKEIDFTAWKGDEPEFYQVTLTMDDPVTEKRETAAFRQMDGGKKVIITMDRNLPDMPNDIEIVNAVDWFLGDA